MHIRSAGLPDAETICGLINLAFRVERFFIDSDRITLDDVRGHFDTGEFLIAEDTGSAVACVYLEPRGERGYLGLLSVHPARQGGGIGPRLVTAGEARCREIGCRLMDIQIVNLREELPPFYRRLGYVETGTASFPPDVPTRLPCHFITMSKPL